MTSWLRRSSGAVAAGVALSSCLFALPWDAQVAAAPAPPVAWAGFAGNAQHTAVATSMPQPFHRIRWKAKVDLHPVLSGRELLIHYGAPMITAANTVLVPTRVSARAGFRVVAYSGTSGTRRWSLNTGYRPPAFLARNGAFAPPLPAVVTPAGTLAVAGAGGTILMRENADAAVGAVARSVFYGAAQWKAHPSVYNKAVHVTTPLTAGPDGAVYFGFTVTGRTPAHLSSGIARIGADGHATWIRARAAAGSPRGHQLRPRSLTRRHDSLSRPHRPQAQHARRAQRHHPPAAVPRRAEGSAHRPAGPAAVQLDRLADDWPGRRRFLRHRGEPVRDP
jgi:hypothetical protein